MYAKSAFTVNGWFENMRVAFDGSRTSSNGCAPRLNTDSYCNLARDEETIMVILKTEPERQLALDELHLYNRMCRVGNEYFFHNLFLKIEKEGSR